MKPVTTERPYAGQLSHERAATRRAALIDAGLDLLGSEGESATTVRAVCKKAGLNSRYFYESFETIDDLLVAVFDHAMEGLMTQAAAEAAAAGVRPREVIAAVATSFTSLLDDPKLARVVLIEAWGNAAVMRRRMERLHEATRLLADVVRLGVRHEPDDETLHLGATIVMGGLLQSVIATVEGRLNLSREQLVERFTELADKALERAADFH